MRRFMLTSAFLAFASPAFASETVTVLSAPVLPQVLILYTGEGVAYPTSQADAEALADASALAFQDLLSACAALEPLYDLIEEPSSAADFAHNYGEIARCAYEQYTSKPYWIPALVDEVDICGRTLGPEWQLLSEADVEAFTEPELEIIRDTLASVDGTSDFGDFYFGLRVWVRDVDGQLAQADLTPGLEGPRVTPLPVSPESPSWYAHLESGLSLRCVSTPPAE